MNIAIIALGSQGDVQPYIALSLGLKHAGHSVRIVTHENFAQAVQAQGIEFKAVQGNVQEFMESPKVRELLEQGNFLAINAHTSKEMERVALLWAEQSLQACQSVDAIVAGIGGLYIGLAIAEKLNLDFIQAHVFPFTPTTAFPGVMFPASIAKLGGTANRISHKFIQQIMWQGFRKADTMMRERILKLAKTPFFGPNTERLNRHPIIYGFSPSVISPPADWDKARVTGYWFLDAAPDWTPPASLETFLESGAPPIYIGFGSMGSRNPEQTAELVLQAVANTKQRAIVQSGWGGLQNNLPDNVYTIQSIPHTWLFPRMAAVVHHGGAGTTAAGLRAGVPSIIIPFFGDQPFWGERAAKLNVGPQPIPRKKLSTTLLENAIAEALSDSKMRHNAAVLGQNIRAEDGIGNAVAAIHQALHQLGH